MATFFNPSMAEDTQAFVRDVLAVPDCTHDRFIGTMLDSDLVDDDPVVTGTRNGAVSLSERRNQVNLQSDLFNRRFEEFNLMGTRESVQNSVNDRAFRVIDENRNVVRTQLELANLGLGLGIGDRERDSRRARVNVNDALIGRRRSGRLSRVSGFRAASGNSDWYSDFGSELELGLRDDDEHDSHVAVDDDFYIGKRKDDNESRNCNGSSSRGSRLRADWDDWGRDCEVNRFDSCLAMESELGDGKRNSHGAVNVNDELWLDTSRDSESRDYSGSSSRVGRLRGRAVWAYSDWDSDSEVEGFHSCLSRGTELRLGVQKHSSPDDADVNDEFQIGTRRENEGRNSNGSASRVSRLRADWDSDADWGAGWFDCLSMHPELGLGDQKHNIHDAVEDEFYFGTRRQNEGQNCNGSSFRVEGLSAVWGESDSESEVEGIENVLSRDLDVGFGVQEHDTHDALNAGYDFCIGRRGGEDESRNCNGSSSRVSGLRAVWGDSYSDEMDDVLLRAHMHSDEGEDFGGVNGDGHDHDLELNQDLEWEARAAMFSPDRWSSDNYLELWSGDSFSYPEIDLGNFFGAANGGNNMELYEPMFGQFTVGENVCLGRPPASKAIVEKLPSVVISKEDLTNEKAICAVCKDQIEVGGVGKELPCSHRYHVDCIIPWLKIRNTCPVCRFELPTDDPAYEQKRMSRAGRTA